MKKVTPVRVDVLKNEDCLTFFGKVAQIAEECLGADCSVIAGEFIQRYIEFKQAVSGESLNTFKILYDADIATDEIWRGLNDEIRAGQRHPNPARREANNVVAEVFGHYEDPTQLPYSEEYSQIHELLDELEHLPQSTLRAAVVDEWIIELRARYEAFMNASKMHMVETTFGEIGSIKRARVAASNAYRMLAERISALASMPTRKTCATFVDDLNAYIQSVPFIDQNAIRRNQRSLMG